MQTSEQSSNSASPVADLSILSASEYKMAFGNYFLYIYMSLEPDTEQRLLAVCLERPSWKRGDD